jgi:hypothetical protein
MHSLFIARYWRFQPTLTLLEKRQLRDLILLLKIICVSLHYSFRLQVNLTGMFLLILSLLPMMPVDFESEAG